MLKQEMQVLVSILFLCPDYSASINKKWPKGFLIDLIVFFYIIGNIQKTNDQNLALNKSLLFCITPKGHISSTSHALDIPSHYSYYLPSLSFQSSVGRVSVLL